jgi:ferredoxin
LDDGKVVECRRSNLTCKGCFICSFAPPNYLDNFARGENEAEAGISHELIAKAVNDAKKAEAGSVSAVATA